MMDAVSHAGFIVSGGLEPHGLPPLLSLENVSKSFVMSYALLRLEINVRASTIIGAVGGGGIGQELKLSISRGFGAKTLALILLLFVTILVVDQLSGWLRRKLVGEQSFKVSR